MLKRTGASSSAKQAAAPTRLQSSGAVPEQRAAYP
jgi:hypothetical protein